MSVGYNVMVVFIATIAAVPTFKPDAKTFQKNIDKFVEFSFNTALCFMVTNGFGVMARGAIKHKCRD